MANYKPLGVPFDRTFRNDLNENFKTLDAEFQKAVNTVSDKAYNQVVDSAKLDWLSPVATFADLSTTYPNAVEGKAAMSRDSGKVYRFDGAAWQEIQQIDSGPVNEVDTRLSSQLAHTTQSLSFNSVKGTTGIFGSSDPRFLDNIGDGYLYGSNSRKLYRTTDINGTWELVHDFGTGDAVNGIRALGDGEVLVIRSTDGLWKSSGWSTNPLTATWSQVLVTNGRVSQFSFDVDTVSGWVTATCYINGDMTNSRYVWLSQDNGNTFTQIFDMVDYDPGLDQTHAHMHICSLDPFHDSTTPRIWISYHKTADDPTNGTDPVKRIKYSDDAGQTWVAFSDSGYQPVVGFATPDGMVFASDEEVVGLYIVRRKENPADMKYELFYAIRENIDGIFGWGTKVIKGNNRDYHVSFRSSVAGFPARVISTDGKRVAETLEIQPATSSDTVDLVDIILYKGQLIGTYYNTATGAGAAYKVVADEPKRGVPSDSAVGGLEGGVAGPLGTSAGFNSKTEMRGTAVGSNSYAELRGTAIGEQALTGAEGTAIGSLTSATGNGTAVGKSASTVNGVAFGRNSSADGDGTAVGTTAEAIDESVAVGSFADATNTQTTALGRLAVASSPYTVALGALANATSTGAVAIGRNAKATYDFSVALGYGTQTTGANQWKVGAKHVEIDNVSVPPSPTSGTRLFSRLNSSNKTELCVLFPTGSIVVIATEA
jgi:hypothetical protein